MMDINEQREPVQDGHDDANESDKLQGIVAQVGYDIKQGVVHDPIAELRTRFAQSGVDVSDDELASIAESLPDASPREA